MPQPAEANNALESRAQPRCERTARASPHYVFGQRQVGEERPKGAAFSSHWSVEGFLQQVGPPNPQRCGNDRREEKGRPRNVELRFFFFFLRAVGSRDEGKEEYNQAGIGLFLLLLNII